MSWEGLFSRWMEESKACSCLQKSDKQSMKNYQPISLLPICNKVLGRSLYKSMFEFFMQSNLITPNWSNFKAGDLCINQLISISHEICKLCLMVATEALVCQKLLKKYVTYSLSQNLLRLFMFYLIFLHYKWNGANLLSPECASCLTRDWTTRILGNDEILEKPQNWRQFSLLPSFPSKNKNLTLAQENWTKLVTIKVQLYLIS